MIEMAMEDSSKKENLEKMIESFINRVAKVISTSRFVIWHFLNEKYSKMGVQ